MRLAEYSLLFSTTQSVARLVLAFVAALTLAACDTGYPSAVNLTPTSNSLIIVTSSSFVAGGAIPRDLTCEGLGVSPALTWSDPPPNARSFALIMDDPDAPNGTFTHWLVFNIPAATRSLPEDLPTIPSLSDGSKQGTNSFGKVGYGGPCPPTGSAHHYHFKLYALDTMLSLTEGISVSQLVSAIRGHLLAAGDLVGTYSR